MVTTAHNGKLSSRDIWPDNPWTETQWMVTTENFKQLLLNDGKSELEASMKASELTRQYYASMPNLRQRQEAMQRIYPDQPVGKSFSLTTEELEYLDILLDQTQNPTGLSLREKLKLDTVTTKPI